MVYQYIAYNTKGDVVRGKLSAATEEAANELLGYAGYKAVSLKPYIPFLSLGTLSAGLSQVRPADVVLFYRQLAMLLESGIDIAASLDLLQQQSTSHLLKKALSKLTSDVRGGNQLSVALEKHPKIFSPIYSRLISIGEKTGELESILRQVADYMEKETATAKQTKGALMMPAITSIIAVIVIGLLITFILPSFTDLYGSLGVELPAVAQLLLTGAEKVRNYGMYILLVVIVLAGVVFIYVKTPGGRYNWDKMLLKLPLVGRVRHLTELARCCRSMSLLFRTGLPLTEIMPMAIQSSGNRVIAEALNDVKQDMVQGEGLSGPMAKTKLFLPMMVQMVKVGEETGNLDVTLRAVAQTYEAEAEDKIHSVIGLIQPTMTILIGGIVGLIALTMTSAMTAMYGEGF